MSQLAGVNIQSSVGMFCRL